MTRAVEVQTGVFPAELTPRGSMVEPNAECCFLPKPSGSFARPYTGGTRLNGVEDSDRDPRGSAESIAVRDNPGESRYGWCSTNAWSARLPTASRRTMWC